MFGSGEVFRYFQCARCGCLQIGEFPPDLSRYYPEDYYSYQPGPPAGRIRGRLIGLRNRYAVWSRGLLGRLLYARRPNPVLRCLWRLPLGTDARILDVGCGSGAGLRSLQELGFRNLLGIDPLNRQDLEHPGGLKVLKRTIHELEGQWDLVMFHHSFEHVPDPAETLLSASRLLSPAGHCVIRTPTVSSDAWEHYRAEWVQLDAPRHLHLHSVESLGLLAGKAGLDPHQVVYDSTAFQFWGSEQYRKGIPLRDPRSGATSLPGTLFSRAELAGFARRAGQLNAAGRGDQAIFYLRKSGERRPG
jgi:SAM-dependent methyltransferase